MTKIAFLGLGAMGSRMAGHLLDAGHDLTVWNRPPGRCEALARRGAAMAKTPRDAAAGAQIVFSMLRDDAASEAVWEDDDTGALAGMDQGAIAVECSTLTVARMKALGETAAVRGVAFLDAPLSGSTPQADEAKLIFLAGGEEGVLDTVRPLLLTMGGAVHHGGPVGAGTALKLIVNAMLGIQVAAVSELLAMGDGLGLAPEKTADILGEIPVTSPIAKAMMGLVVAGDDEPRFPVELVEKDFGNILAAALSAETRVPVAEATVDVYRKALDEGLGARNITGVARLYRKL